MEYEWAYVPEPNDFGSEMALGSVRLPRVDQDPRDAPPPIHYDDEYGKTTLGFAKIGIRDGYKMYDIVYKHNGEKPHRLSKFLGPGFFFWWTNNTPFFTLSRDGAPIVSVNYGALASSRNHLLSLAHEIGHTHQYDVDRDLWQLLGTEVSAGLVRKLKGKYPTLVSHIDDLTMVRTMAQTTDPDTLHALSRKVTHKPLGGFKSKGIDESLLEDADDFINLGRDIVPVGPTHYGDFFMPNHLSRTLPAVYLILDAMGEQRAWEHATELEKKGIIHSGFKSDAKRADYMRPYLQTYDRKYQTTAYTDWLG